MEKERVIPRKSPKALALRQVEKFDVVGLTFLFPTGLMLVFGNSVLVGFPEICVTKGVFVRDRNLVPQGSTGGYSSSAKAPSYQLSGAAAKGNP